MRGVSRSCHGVVVLVAVAMLVLGLSQGAAASVDSIYTYAGATPLADLANGAVLKVHTVQAHLGGESLPMDAVQILYRTTDMVGHPTMNVTTVLKPWFTPVSQKVVAYGSFYDSLNPADEPSRALSGQSDPRLGGVIANLETLLVQSYVTQGYTVVITDTEGQHADFAAGPEYGRNTLDGLRAALSAKQTGLTGHARIALAGYSGGAIATAWAGELAPTYAPDIERRLVGASMGGVLVDPDHNLHYVEGSSVWAGVMPMAVAGIARAFDVDLRPYLNARGLSLSDQGQNDSIVDVLFRDPGLTWTSLAKPAYVQPEMVPEFVRSANQLILGRGTPGIPLLIYQGGGGTAEGTPVNKQYGPGDGVMVTGDVRGLARTYCSRGVPVEYHQLDHESHVGTAPAWISATTPWLAARFAGAPAPDNCTSIAPGNSLASIPQPG